MKNKKAKTSIWITLILVLCLGAVSSANAETLTLISLECFQTEDSEIDEAQLRIREEDGSNTRYKRNMRSGDIWQLNKQIIFTRRIVVSLYDLDDGPFDHNDYLGSFYLNSVPINGVRSFTFNQDGANYRLRYRVGE
jgi:hypothetical protein